MHVPQLTAYHTLENSQGTLDPLGMYSIADRLALKLAPGLRERMKHPRYLTAIAVSSLVCDEFDEDRLAEDGVSPPWQVFEWHVVSGLVKRFHKTDQHEQLRGMPGRDKTTAAMMNDLQLSANRYLKTPSVFGFHGVYRTLARNIGLLNDNSAGALAFRLAEVWEEEQQLHGFVRKNNAGGNIRSRWTDAVEQGLIEGKVSKPWRWEQFPRMAEYLAPKSPGRRERDVILDVLINGGMGERGELIGHLINNEGRKIAESGSEKKWHEYILTKPLMNHQLLKAILAYEKFCRLLYNAFYEMLLLLKKNNGKGTFEQFVALPRVKRASNEIPAAYDEAEKELAFWKDEVASFSAVFAWSAQHVPVNNWVQLLLHHHINVQKQKPPAPKAPWLLENAPGRFILHTIQELDVDLNNDKDEYVHQYRMKTLYSFLKDFGKI